MAENEQQTVSLKMDAFVKGGLIGDVDLLVKSMIWTFDGPPGYTEKALFVKSELEILSDGSSIDQWWSAGTQAAELFVPAEPDGKRLLRVKDKQGLTDSSNFFHLRQSFARHGFPDEKVTDTLACFEKMIFHGIRVPQPERSGLKTKEKKGNDRDPTVLVASAIIALPWEDAKRAAAIKKAQSTMKTGVTAGSVAPPAQQGSIARPPANGAPAPTTTAAAAPPVADGDTEGLAINVLATLLNEATDGKIDRGQVKVDAFRKMVKQPAAVRNAVGKLISDDEWLNAHTELAPGLLMMVDAESNSLIGMKS